MSVIGCTENRSERQTEAKEMTQQQEEKRSKQAGTPSEALRHAVTDRLSIKIKEIKFLPCDIFADMKSQK